MAKKGNWLVTVKRAFSCQSKAKKKEKSSKLKKTSGLEKEDDFEISSLIVEVPARPPAPPVEAKLTVVENEQTKDAYSVDVATVVDAESAQAAQETVQLTNVTRNSGNSKEELAAIKIQTAFRGHLARRALRALRGLLRLKTLIHGHSVKRQATSTLRCMQTLARVQSQVRARRIRMSEENQALQRQLQQKREKELEQLKMGDNWDDSMQSKEQVEANLLNRQEAAMRRERALAYAHSHQQVLKNSSRSSNPTFMDPTNPHWGWSWLERWMAARPWENRSMADKELNIDNSSVKRGEITKSYARRELNSERPSPKTQKPTRQSPSTPSSVAGKLKSASPHGGQWTSDDDSKSMASMQSERYRRHSVAGSSVRDDESLASSSSVPSYMAPTKSAKAKTRLQSTLGVEKNEVTPEKGPVGSVKKRLSFSPSPAGPRRHSGPAKIDFTDIKDNEVQIEDKVINGETN
ncbi:hypothetical protein GIB67_030312 [Kingdonia uniflora]|uniref:DUF4005 domain-containing protein n=1 Tax=Kingdonia uniflora TaxID=39325 RepID=A0A7J7M6I9_9MAGN|nr:hypothetical protein GIB67_030312 [Kingdonia uniflora]